MSEEKHAVSENDDSNSGGGGSSISATESSFPNIGVSLAALRNVCKDARMQQSMVSLARPDLSPADVDAMSVPELCEVAKEIRVLSHLDGKEEFARYDPGWERSRWTRAVDAEGNKLYRKILSPAALRDWQQRMVQLHGKVSTWRRVE